MRDISPEEKLYFYVFRMNQTIVVDSWEEVIEKGYKNLVVAVTNFLAEKIEGPTAWYCYRRSGLSFLVDQYYRLVFGDTFMVPKNVVMRNVIGIYPGQLWYKIFWELDYSHIQGSHFIFFESEE